MGWESNNVFQTILIEGAGGGAFVYDAGNNLRIAIVGQTTTDPVQGITCQAGQSFFNASGAVLILISNSNDALFIYRDLGTSTQGALVGVFASAAGTEPLKNTSYTAGFTNIDPAFADSSNVIGATIKLQQLAFTRQAQVGANTGSLATSPFIQVDAPEQGGATPTHMQMKLQGSSPDGTHLGQALIGQVAGGGALIPVTSSMLEVQSQGAGLTDPVIVIVGFAGGATTDPAFGIRMSGDTFNRLRAEQDGRLRWGPGNVGQDTNLYRSAVNTLKTDDALIVAMLLTALAGLSVTGGTTTDTLSVTTSETVTAAGGGLLKITETAGAPAAPPTQCIAHTAGDRAFGIEVTGDTNFRFRVDSNGRHDWSSGAAGPDASLQRDAANHLLILTADLDIGTAGRGLQIKEGANARMGVSTLAAGTVVVSNTSVTASTRIFLTCQTPGGTPGFLRISAVTAGTSFTILSSSATDTSVVAWLLVEPG